MTRTRLLLGVLGLLVAAGALALVGWAWVRGAAEDELRHGEVAAQVFDSLEAELSELIQREEQRSFLEYRHYYVPGRQALGAEVGLVRSPLAELPEDGAVLGWFQVDPDGEVFLPHEPRAGELALAAADGWTPCDDLEATRPSLEAGALLATTHAAALPGPELAVVQAPAPAWQTSLPSSLNRGASKRSSRYERTEKTTRQNVVSFVDKRAPDLREAITVPSPSGVDVTISAFTGTTGEDHAVLYRTVEVDEGTFLQGLVLDRARLQEQLGAASLTPGLATYATLGWDQAPQRTYSFKHAFAAPFDDWTAILALDPLPGKSTTLWPLLGLTGLLGLALGLGTLGLDRMIATELEFAQRRTDFVAAVSHELKTPLTSIRMYAEMLRDGVVLSEDHRQGYYVTIAAESERLSRLIANVLELARLERGAAVDIGVGAVASVIDELAAVLGPQLTDQGFTLDLDVPPDLPAVRMERDSLLQVLVNLVDNSVKFTVAAEDHRVHVTARASESHVVITVRDHGPGIPPSQLARVLEPFVRGERELTRTTRGTGIGLALVRGLVAQMDGTLRLTNHPSGGLCVDVTLQRA